MEEEVHQMTLAMDHRNYYRLPWSFPDNGIGWLEVTTKCNLYCEGCYRQNNPFGHKTLHQIREEVGVFKRLRTFDSMSIAGGDPLIHPDIVEIVRHVAKEGFKPIINTNGIALTKDLIRALKDAGAVSFTIHVDSKQQRPQWKGKSEVELNSLRLQFAEMIAEVGGVGCGFNSTVYADTLHQVPEIVEWGQKHIDIVNLLVFICFRGAALQNFDFYVGNEPADMSQMVYLTSSTNQKDISSVDVVEVLKSRFPEFESAAYLNGTEKPDTFKWLLNFRIGSKEEIYGYVGPKFIELAQIFHHLRYGKYLSYSPLKVLKRGKWMLLLAPIDKGVRKAAGRFARAIVKNPFRIFRPAYCQSIMMIQPIDFLPDGSQSMCDACPDVTVLNGRLVWSCRVEEPTKYGVFLRTVPKKKPVEENLTAPR